MRNIIKRFITIGNAVDVVLLDLSSGCILIYVNIIYLNIWYIIFIIYAARWWNNMKYTELFAAHELHTPLMAIKTHLQRSQLILNQNTSTQDTATEKQQAD